MMMAFEVFINVLNKARLFHTVKAGKKGPNIDFDFFLLYLLFTIIF